MSSLQTLPKGDSAWLLRKAIERIMQQISVLETNIGSSTTGNSDNTQIIFNDAGTLRGDAQFTWNKTLNRLTVDGDEIITGGLTVASNVLKVDSANERVGVLTATPGFPLHVNGTDSNNVLFNGVTKGIRFSASASTSSISGVDNTGSLSYQPLTIEGSTLNFSLSGTTAMTLNSTGLAIGDTAFAGTRLTLRESATNPNALAMTNRNATQTWRLSVDTAAVDDKILGFYDSTSATFRMQLTDTGNVGIGVTPKAWAGDYKAFQVSQISAFWGNSAVTQVSSNIYWDGAIRYITAQAGSFLQFSGKQLAFNQSTDAVPVAGGVAAYTQAMTLAATGNLLVGTTTDIAAVRMQVWSADSNNTAYFRNSNATTPYGPSVKYTAATPNNTGSEFLYCEDSTAVRVALRSNGGIANYQANNVSLSDSRMKSDIKPLGSYWNKIKSLEVVTFKYNDQTHSDDNIGLIAQQVESVAPELVDVDGFGETPVDGVPLKTIYTTDLYHASIKALQEAMSRIEALEAKLA
jgi:hypothetical protein